MKNIKIMLVTMFVALSGVVCAASTEGVAIPAQWDGYYVCVSTGCNEHFVIKGNYFESSDCKSEISKILSANDNKIIFQIKDKEKCSESNGPTIKLMKFSGDIYIVVWQDVNNNDIENFTVEKREK